MVRLPAITASSLAVVAALCVRAAAQPAPSADASRDVEAEAAPPVEQPLAEPETPAIDDEARTSQHRLAAETLFQEAVSLRDQGQWTVACEKFAASHELSPARGTLLNIAECHEHAGDIASAWSSYKELEDLAQATDDTERLVIALRKTRELEPRLPRVAIRVAPAGDIAGLEVKLNGMPVDATLMGVHMPVDAGEHVVEASAPGHEPWSQRVTLAESEKLDITVPRLTAAAPMAPSAVEAEGAGPAAIFGPEPIRRTFNIKVNPFGLMQGTSAIMAEIRVGESTTFSPTIAYAEMGETSVLGAGVRLSFYLQGEALAGGVYIAPFGNVVKLELGRDEATAFAIGGIAGHQWIWDNGFNIGAGAGLVYYALTDADPDFDFSGTGLTFEVTLGMAF